jgi:excisionase family DNA binding protein
MHGFEKELYRPDEVARLLRVSVRTVRRWAGRGKIEHMRTPGKAIRIPKRELARLVREG